jgi:DNA/RNA-binding domain of Phe-tRNA-synthetase-like protein
MNAVVPSIDPALSHVAPGFRALSITVESAPVQFPAFAEVALNLACKNMLENDFEWASAHLHAWSEVFKAFGAKPKRTPCSAEALRKRVFKDGSLPAIDPIVDLYNAVSIRYAIPVGGENITAYVGSPRLTIAGGSEIFDTVKEGELATESPDPGEVIWRDDLGVTCRRWNWRQGVRTRLDSQAKNMWFILESLPEMPLQALYEACEMLTNGIVEIMPGAKISSQLLKLE